MAQTQDQSIIHRGIYHGLPTYPPELKGLTAIVAGANGISGSYMLKALAQSPHRWTKIYALSRRKPSQPLPPNTEFTQADLLGETSALADTLKEKGVKPDYAFFFAYAQAPALPGQHAWSNLDATISLNQALFDNFLSALETCGSVSSLKKVILQTGAKYYGVHLGPTLNPQEEHLPPCKLEKNFYFLQEESLLSFAERNNVSWNIVMPSYIIGAVPEAQMSLALPLALYASLCRKLGAVFDFPADIAAWQAPMRSSSGMLNGYFAEWVALSKSNCERFNMCDDGIWSWEGTWPRIAAWYGIEYRRPQDGDSYDDVPWSALVPRGYGPPGKGRSRFWFQQWYQQPHVQAAWRELVEEHGLVYKELREQDFFGLDAATKFHSGLLGVDKARKRGWNGFVDTNESFFEVFGELERLKIIPPVPNVKVEFL